MTLGLPAGNFRLLISPWRNRMKAGARRQNEQRFVASRCLQKEVCVPDFTCALPLPICEIEIGGVA
jgi:hypothetical protein